MRNLMILAFEVQSPFLRSKAYKKYRYLQTLEIIQEWIALLFSIVTFLKNNMMHV